MAGVRVRFCPSPTGALHLGGLRTALYNYALARKMNGAFVLRIDDTNPEKAVSGAVDKMMRIFDWLGITFNEGPHVGGAYGPYVQSQRQQLYHQVANELVKTGAAYHCFCTKERLQFLRSYRAGYDGHCRKLTDKQISNNLLSGMDHVIRLKVPVEGQITVDDDLHGNTQFECSTLDDQVLLKSNGSPTYHLATVVDDHMMQMSHVIRGEDLLPSTAKHVLLYNALNWTIPRFVHLPLLLSDTGKMSKRHGDVAVETYKEDGYLADTIVNYTALQGWSSDCHNEVFNLQQFADMFSLSSLNKASCRLNRDKLVWLNRQHLLLQYHRNPDVLINELRHHVISSFSEYKIISEEDHRVSDSYLHTIIPLALEVTHTIPNMVKEVSYYWKAPTTVKLDDKEVTVMQSIMEHLDLLPGQHGEDDYSNMLKNIATLHEMAVGKLMRTCRNVITGGKAGPKVVTLMNVMGRELLKQRLSQIINE